MQTLHAFLESKVFTFIILGLYGCRCISYMITKHYGPGAYWLFAFGITVSAEFLIKRFP